MENRKDSEKKKRKNSGNGLLIAAVLLLSACSRASRLVIFCRPPFSKNSPLNAILRGLSVELLFCLGFGPCGRNTGNVKVHGSYFDTGHALNGIFYRFLQLAGKNGDLGIRMDQKANVNGGLAFIHLDRDRLDGLLFQQPTADIGNDGRQTRHTLHFFYRIFRNGRHDLGGDPQASGSVFLFHLCCTSHALD